MIKMLKNLFRKGNKQTEETPVSPDKRRLLENIVPFACTFAASGAGFFTGWLSRGWNSGAIEGTEKNDLPSMIKELEEKLKNSETENQQLAVQLAEFQKMQAEFAKYEEQENELRLDFSLYPYQKEMRVFEPYLTDTAERYFGKNNDMMKLFMLTILKWESWFGQNNIAEKDKFAGAYGPWQFDPKTGREYGLRVEKNDNYEKAMEHRNERMKAQKSRDKFRAMYSGIIGSYADRIDNIEKLAEYLKENDKEGYNRFMQLENKIRDAEYNFYKNMKLEKKYIEEYRLDMENFDKLLEWKKTARDGRVDIPLATNAAGLYIAGLKSAAKVKDSDEENLLRVASAYNSGVVPKNGIAINRETVGYIEKIANDMIKSISTMKINFGPKYVLVQEIHNGLENKSQ